MAAVTRLVPRAPLRTGQPLSAAVWALTAAAQRPEMAEVAAMPVLEEALPVAEEAKPVEEKAEPLEIDSPRPLPARPSVPDAASGAPSIQGVLAAADRS